MIAPAYTTALKKQADISDQLQTDDHSVEPIRHNLKIDLTLSNYKIARERLTKKVGILCKNSKTPSH
jgi:hypothetical protein